MRLFDLIKIWEPAFTPEQAKVHLARHNDVEPPLAVYLRGQFEEWQRWQNGRNFQRRYVVSLVNVDRPTRWLYAGLFISKGYTREPAPSKYCEYDLVRVASADAWAGRLFLESVYVKRNSYLLGETLAEDLTVTELLAERLSIGQFPGYKLVNITIGDLEALVRHGAESWRAALAAVKGIYVISDSATGKLYVGKADGGDGIWGRWSTYARTVHGHNVALEKEFGLDATAERKKDLRFSVLEIADLNATDIDDRETHWKRVLNSRAFGYNRN
jgi:hypothetical protein